MNFKDKIYTIRNKQVMLDSDLAELYEVETRRINEQVKRNKERFPSDFYFQLTSNELKYILRSQNATSSLKHGGRRYEPIVFTEHGVTALAGILRSKVASEMNVKIIKLKKDLEKNLCDEMNESCKITEITKFDDQLMIKYKMHNRNYNTLRKINNLSFLEDKKEYLF